MPNVALVIPLLLLSTWEVAPPFPDQTQGRAYVTGIAKADTLIALGGTPFDIGPDAVVNAIPVAGTNWASKPPLNGDFIHQGAGIDALGRIVVFGGVKPDAEEEPNPEVYVYDLVDGPTTGLARRDEGAPPKLFATATDAQKRIYSIGGGPGANANSGNPNSAWVERYDGTGDSWQPLSAMPSGVADAAAAFDGTGHIFVFGGFVSAGGARTSNVASYDIATDTWSDASVPDMPVALTGHRAILGADARVYVLGGESGPVSGGTIENRTFVLDLATNTWSTGPTMLDARRHFGVVLGSDSRIYALGGANSGTGVWRCETLYTPLCPVISPMPTPKNVWESQSATFSATVTGGPPLSFQWRRDGVPLVDGPAPGGGIISGATTTTLIVTDVHSVDAGVFDLVVQNGCGSVSSNGITLVVRTPPSATSQWTVVNLHPSGYLYSSAGGISGNQQVGTARKTDATYGSLDHPILWTGSAESAVDLTPSNSVGGGIYANSGNIQVGWWWWPYQCYISGQWYTCYSQTACLWQGTAASHVNLQVSGYEYSNVVGTDGTRHAGSGSWDDASGNYYTHAFRWSGVTNSYIDLHPSANVSKSGLSAIDGDHEYGSIQTPYPGPVSHAAMWSGTSASFVDLHPPGAASSGISGAGDGLQAGSATIAGAAHAALWAGDVASFHDINPAGATTSSAAATKGGVQVGWVTLEGATHAAAWFGSAASFLDLHASAGPNYSITTASDVDVNATGEIRIVGTGYNTTTSRNEALLWVQGGATEAPAVSELANASAGGLRLSPNPSTGSTQVVFETARRGLTTVDVFDISGRRVRTVLSASVPPGRHGVTWDGKDEEGVPVAPGVYFVQLRSGGIHEQSKLTLLR